MTLRTSFTSDCKTTYNTTTFLTYPNSLFWITIFDDGALRLHPDDDKDLLSLVTRPSSKECDPKKYVFIDHFHFENMNELKFSETAKKCLASTNAGGKSIISEMMSIEYYIRSFGVSDVLLEMEVGYWFCYKMVDYVCTISTPDFEKLRISDDDALKTSFEKKAASRARNEMLTYRRLGVSVTRAMGFPNESFFKYDDAQSLMRKKVYGLIVARNAVIKEHKFYKSVLHILCQSTRIARLMRQAYKNLDMNDFSGLMKGYIIIHLTVCPEPLIYSE